MATKVKGEAIKEGSIPLSALADDVKDKIENAGADWNAQNGEAGYIENRTHYRIRDSFIDSYNGATIGSIVLGTKLPIMIANNSMMENSVNQREIIVDKLDIEFNVPSVGPGIKAKITYDGTNYIYEQLTAFGVVNELKFYRVFVQPLQDWFIPDTIVRKNDIKTINGESIVGSGDIVIEGETLTESDITAMGFTKNTGTYSKPSGGIPKTDLASDIQTSLGKADTALQSHQDISGKQDTLISGMNIKTVNGESILGSGDITISGGSSSGGSGAYSEVNHGTSDTTFTLTPNTFHVWDEVASLTLDFGSETNGVANEYLFQFTSGATATSLTLPDDIKWAEELVIDANRIYQISILKGLANVLSWDNVLLIENHITYNEGSFVSGGTIMFEYPTASELIFTMNHHSSNELIIPQGTTNMNISWNEPIAPSIVSITPSEDLIYKYILS